MPSINFYIREVCEQYGADHVKSTPYYPQGNGQVEATNKTLLIILSLMVYDEPKRWVDFISLVLSAYQTSKRTSTKLLFFHLSIGLRQ